MKRIIYILNIIMLFLTIGCNQRKQNEKKDYNKVYTGENLNRLAFPLGGMGAGMICIEGNGCISNVSVRHKPDIFNEPYMFASIAVRGAKHGAKVLEGSVPKHKIFGSPLTGNGAGSNSYGLPRFDEVTFEGIFPFANLSLKDKDIPLEIKIKAWSPFTPCDENNSSLPLAGLEYTFTNTTDSVIEMVFAYHSQNFMRISHPGIWGIEYEEKGDSVQRIKNGFVLSQSCFPDKPHFKGDFAIFTQEEAIVDYCWFRGGWFDGQTQLWRDVESMALPSDTNTTCSTAASLYIPVKLKKGESKTIHLMFAWYVPHSDQHFGPAEIKPVKDCSMGCDPKNGCSSEFTSQFYEPWYSGQFKDIFELVNFWNRKYEDLFQKSQKFSQTFFSSDLPMDVLEAVSANLSILKSPTVLRQKDGKLYAFEGCFDSGSGCCQGSCTHVWNYAQAIPHLFPALERSLRETEFLINQDEKGHQNFRAALPIAPTDHGWHAAADGQIGGFLKIYRDWHILGDTEWLRKIWPKVKASFEFSQKHWDPKEKGILEEPHHNTYDIEFWGPDGMCTSIYLNALQAMIEMSKAMNEDTEQYEVLLAKGKKYMESELYNGEYFFQKVVWEGLVAPNPLKKPWNIDYSSEALELLKNEGPKYQYGNGCLSDGVIGAWFSDVCGLPGVLDKTKIKSHLNAVYKYNFKNDLSDHVNPQRSGFAVGKEGGLILCTWPNGKQPTLPFVYSNEVWTGIEYQVAAHLIMNGEVEKGLNIVRAIRSRYNGMVRNPFNEYECGHWYARALSSYSLLQAFTGLRYDALTKTLYIDSKIGKNFKSFISTNTGYGLAGLKDGKPFIDVVYGRIDVQKFENKSN